MLLNNGLTRKKDDQEQAQAEHIPYKRVKQNTANIRALNDHNETPLFYASQERKYNFGWNTETGMIVNYD